MNDTPNTSVNKKSKTTVFSLSVQLSCGNIFVGRTDLCFSTLPENVTDIHFIIYPKSLGNIQKTEEKNAKLAPKIKKAAQAFKNSEKEK